MHVQPVCRKLCRSCMETVAAAPADSYWSCVQVECHPYFTNETLLQWCKSRRIHVTAYSPLGSPDSASMFKRKAPLLMQDPIVRDVAERLSRSPAQVRPVPPLPCPALPCPALAALRSSTPFTVLLTEWCKHTAMKDDAFWACRAFICAVAGYNSTSHSVITN